MITRLTVLLLAALPLFGFTSCERRPEVPREVKVVVEKMTPPPSWATDPLAKPEPADGTVGARTRSHEARGAVIDVANCHRRLLARLGRGEHVDPKECNK